MGRVMRYSSNSSGGLNASPPEDIAVTARASPWLLGGAEAVLLELHGERADRHPDELGGAPLDAPARFERFAHSALFQVAQLVGDGAKTRARRRRLGRPVGRARCAHLVGAIGFADSRTAQHPVRKVPELELVLVE